MDMKPCDATHQVEVSNVDRHGVRKVRKRFLQTTELLRRQQQGMQSFWLAEKPLQDEFRLGHEEAITTSKITVPHVPERVDSWIIKRLDLMWTVHEPGESEAWD